MLDPNAAIMSWEQADQIIQDQRTEIERLRGRLACMERETDSLRVAIQNLTDFARTQTLTDEELRATMHGAISLRMHAGELSNAEAVENIMNLAKTLDRLREKHE
jgi:hypothetical protein